jgi:DNA invertase Pin-like site-specific DNA recombinase
MATTRHSPSEGVTTALIYTRVSKEEQKRDGISLDAQLTDCRRYSARPGWRIGREFQDVMSGKKDHRPDYQALLAEVRRLREEGQAVVVVVKWLHRLGRRVLEQVRCRDELKTLGVAVHSGMEGGEVSDLVANILASVAEEEVRQLGERTAAVKQHIRATGWHPTGRVPWGYRNRLATDAERGQGAPKVVLDLDTETAPFAREAFQRIADGASIRQVAVWAASLPKYARGNRQFSVRSMVRTLTSPTVLGRVAVEAPSAHWPALIDGTLWDSVQARLWRHRVIPVQASGKALLTGFARCERCGSRMYSWSYWNRQRPKRGYDERNRLRAYACEGKNMPGACRRVAQPADDIDALVRAEVVALLEAFTERDTQGPAALARAWAALQAPPDSQAKDAQRAQLERTAAQARQRLLRATEMYVDGKLARDAYEPLCEKARAELETATAALQCLEPPAHSSPELPPLAAVLADLGGWAPTLAAADVPTQRDVLVQLVQAVTPVRVRRGHYRVEITWTPLGDALRALVRPGAVAA